MILIMIKLAYYYLRRIFKWKKNGMEKGEKYDYINGELKYNKY